MAMRSVYEQLADGFMQATPQPTVKDVAEWLERVRWAVYNECEREGRLEDVRQAIENSGHDFNDSDVQNVATIFSRKLNKAQDDTYAIVMDEAIGEYYDGID